MIPDTTISSATTTQPSFRIGRTYLIVLVGSLIFYIATVAPGVIWQDGGRFQVRTLRHDLYDGSEGLALSHPLHHLLTRAFQWLPIGDSAYRTNLVSAVFGALTVTNIGLLLRLITGRWRGAIIGAIVLAVAHTFWQHCALTEVYTVTTALLSIELLCLQRYAQTRDSRWLIAMFAINGLNVSNHLMAGLSFGCYGILLLVLVLRKQISWRLFVIALGCWTLAGGLYWGMVLGKIMTSGNVASTLRSAFFGSYSQKVLNTKISIGQLKKSILYVGLNFPTPLLLLLPVGLWSLWKSPRQLFGTVLTALLIVHLAWAVHYDVPDQYAFFILTIVLMAVVLGLGIDYFLATRPHPRSRSNWTYGVVAAALLPALIYIPLPQLAKKANIFVGIERPFRDGYDWFLHPYKTGDRSAEKFIAWLEEYLPPHAVLIADDTVVRPVHYMMLTRHWRPDVTVYPTLDEPETIPSEQQVRDALIQGRLFVVTARPGYCPDWLLENYETEPFGKMISRVTGPKPSASHPATP
ncbi:MAG: DUF2723 domain-containing protein [Phycisphaerae bacterium]|nr:DUF2723 domain-containing protein [Phycisphaerae bacterium]